MLVSEVRVKIWVIWSKKKLNLMIFMYKNFFGECDLKWPFEPYFSNWYYWKSCPLWTPLGPPWGSLWAQKLNMTLIMDFLTKLSVNRQPTYHASFDFNFGSWSIIKIPWGLPWRLVWAQKLKLTSKTAFLTKIPVNRHPTCNISINLNFGPLPPLLKPPWLHPVSQYWLKN